MLDLIVLFILDLIISFVVDILLTYTCSESAGLCGVFCEFCRRLFFKFNLLVVRPNF